MYVGTATAQPSPYSVLTIKACNPYTACKLLEVFTKRLLITDGVEIGAAVSSVVHSLIMILWTGRQQEGSQVNRA